MDSWVLNQHTTPCMDVVRTIPTFIKFYLQGILHKYSVFYTQRYPIYSCLGVANMIVLLNYMATLTCLRNGRFWWENIEISQNATALIANMSNRKRNSRNSPYGNTLNVNCCTKWGRNWGRNSPYGNTLNVNCCTKWGKRQNFTNSQHNLCY